MEKSPLSSAVAVPKTTDPLNRVTLELASAVPVIAGVGLLVRGEVVAKAEGVNETVSTVIEREEDLEETLPAESVADALIEYVPSEIAEEGVNEKAPLVSAVVVPKVEESINRVTLELASAVPVIAGVGLLVRGEVVAKAEGVNETVSTVKEIAEDSVEVLPAVSTALTVSE